MVKLVARSFIPNEVREKRRGNGDKHINIFKSSNFQIS